MDGTDLQLTGHLATVAIILKLGTFKSWEGYSIKC
jgi:hypothetical protein